MVNMFRRCPVASLLFVLAVSAVSVVSAGCSKPNADESVRKGTAYFDQERYPEAIIELRRAVQIDPRHGKARAKLAEAYARTHDAANALREYVRAADLLPGDLDVQRRAGAYLLLARQFEDAKARADRALEIAPADVEAQILRGNALAGLKDFDAAIGQYEEAIAADPSRHQAFVNLGTIQYARGKKPEAEAAFRRAIATAPTSTAAKLALANFLWSDKRTGEAEAMLKEALAGDPRNVVANRALGVLYMATGRTVEAEPYFKALAADRNNTAAMVTLAQYYASTKRRAEARRVLQDVANRPDGFALATVRLAALDTQEGQSSEAAARLRDVLAKNPNDASALLLQAGLLFADRKREDALKAVNVAIAADPSAARAHYLAGRILVDSDRPDEAIQEFKKVLQLDTRAVDAQIQLARLHLLRGEADNAIIYGQQALSLEPDNAEAKGVLARSYLRQGNIPKAEEMLTGIQKGRAASPGVLNLQAAVQLARHKPDPARAYYLQTLQLDPNDREALSGLVSLDVSAGRPADATARLDALLGQHRDDVDLLLVGARGYAQAQELAKSESAAKRALAVDPGRLDTYSHLGQLYYSQRRFDEAKQQFQELSRRDPKSVRAATMVGMILQVQGHAAEAEKEYERALSIDPRAALAANNLANLYLAGNRKLDEALQLAQMASAMLPDDPNISDTLGWVYVRKNMGSLAVRPLESSVQRAPKNAVFHYHLGMAYLQAGSRDKARAALSKALELQPDFQGAPDARKALATLGS